MNLRIGSALTCSLLAAALLGGCANPYEKYFSPNMSYRNPAGAEPPQAPGIQVIRGTNVDADVASMFGQGYGLIGYSAFNGKEVSTNLASAEGRKLGATRVLVYEKYTNTEESAEPVVLPTFGSVVTRGAGATLKTSMLGATTTMVPVSVRRYDQFATYWAPIPPGILGASARNLSRDEREHLQSNRGVVVTLLRDDSPAFEADILTGDIVRTIGQTQIDDLRGLQRALTQYAGQTVDFAILRDGKQITKTVKLNAAS